MKIFLRVSIEKLVQPIDADDNGQELAGELNFKGVDELGIGKLIILFRPSVSEGRLAMEDGFYFGYRAGQINLI
jgi:hypothetical protein